MLGVGRIVPSSVSLGYPGLTVCSLHTHHAPPLHCGRRGPVLTLLREMGMSKILRGLAAGYGAKKLGGGCFSTVLIFLILWWVLGQCGGPFA